jgi:hypothetical protein
MAFISRDQSQLLLFPEVRVGDGSGDAEVRPINVTSVPMRSPFRYPNLLARRVMEIAQKAGRIRFEQGDAFEVLSRYESEPGTTFFLDPPYTAGGKRAGTRLYRHWEVDHARLFEACCYLRGSFLMTYDDAPEIHALAARHGLKVRRCLMSGSSHRRELGFPAAVALFSPQGSSIRSLVR